MDEDGLALLQTTAQGEREVRRVVVEDQTRAVREVELGGQREREELGRDSRLGESAEPAERGHAVALGDLGARGRTAYDPGNLAAGHERQRRFDLVLAPRLHYLGGGQ